MPPMSFKVPGRQVSFGLQWDCLDTDGVDLDLQAVVVSNGGLIVDAAYYNNVSAVDGAVSLSGDEQRGDADGYDESLAIKLTALPPQVKLIILVVAVYGKGHLRDVDNGQMIVVQNGAPMHTFKLEQSGGDCDIVAFLRRTSDGWELVQVDEPAEFGSHFLDILEPNIGNVVRREIPDAPSYLKVSFEMEKGALMPLPKTSALKRVFVGIGGTVHPKRKKEVDIDVSAVFVSTTGSIIGSVDGTNHAMYGVEHTGDRLAGNRVARGGDDEAISIDLAQVPRKVRCIFLVLSISDGTFSDVRTAYARIIDQTATELVRYNIKGEQGGTSTGLIIAKLLRSKGRRWGFLAIGAYYDASAKSWKGARPLIRALFRASEEHQEDGEMVGDPDEPPGEEDSPVGGGTDLFGGGVVGKIVTTSTNRAVKSVTSLNSTESVKRVKTLTFKGAAACRAATVNLEEALEEAVAQSIRNSGGLQSSLNLTRRSTLRVTGQATTNSDREPRSRVASRDMQADKTIGGRLVRKGTMRLTHLQFALDGVQFPDDDDEDDPPRYNACRRLCNAQSPFFSFCGARPNALE